MARVMKSSVAASPVASRDPKTSSRVTETTTATDAPQAKAKISSRGGSGSHRSSHR